MTSRTTGSLETTAAFFDLDGTLLAAPSLEWRFLAWLLAHDEIPLVQAACWFARFSSLCLRDPHAATEGNKTYLTGLRESLASEWENSLPPGSLAPFARGLQRIRWHLARQHQIFFISGTLEPLANAVARNVARRVGATTIRELPVQIEVCATQLEICDGRWTGFIAGEHRSGQAKARAIRALGAKHGLDLARSFAYGNAITDLPMLAAVGFPVAVNPSTRLERAARVRGWKICYWKELSSPPRFAPRFVGTQWLSPKGAR
jgi:HAD superfamily hydrolase (TIGR01490 family)